MTTADQHTQNANARLMFALPNVDPFDTHRAPLRLVPPAEQNPDYRLHLVEMDDQAREVDGYEQREAEVVRFVRRRPFGGVA